MKKERNEVKIAICKDAMMMYVNTRELKNRMDCLHWVMGYLRARGITSVPFDLIDAIDELYYDGTLTA